MARVSTNDPRHPVAPPDADAQALLVVAHLSSAATSNTAATHRRDLPPLVTGFGNSTATVYRYLREALELPAAMAPSRPAVNDRGRPRKGLRHPRRNLAADRPGRHELRSGPALLRGRHQCHRVNVQVIADPTRTADLGLTGPARRAARHGRAREHGIVEVINTAGVQAVADTASQGGDPAVRVWQRRRRLDTTPPRRPMSRSQREVNYAHAHRRDLDERANGELKSGKILRKIRASPSRMTTLVQAVQHLSSWADQTGKAYGTQQVRNVRNVRSPPASIRTGRTGLVPRYPAAMVDAAGSSFVLRDARVTSTAVQPGAESAAVMSVIDVSTEHTNRHRATDPAPRTVGRRDRVRPASRDGARRPFHGAEIESRRPLNPMLRARPQASARIEESVILVTV